jgi:hypothetical protein
LARIEKKSRDKIAMAESYEKPVKKVGKKRSDKKANRRIGGTK